MEQHSLFHGITEAKCNTAWDKMVGSDSVRTCPRCKETVIAAEGLDECEVIRLVAAAEPQKKANELKLYRRPDGKLMTGKSDCNIRALLEFYFSWPMFLLLIGGYGVMVFTAMHTQFSFVVSLANHIAYVGFLALAVLAVSFDFEIKIRGKAQSVRIWFGTVSTLAMLSFALLRVFNVPVWLFAKDTLVPYLASLVVLGIVFIVMKEIRDRRRSRNRLDDSQHKTP